MKTRIGVAVALVVALIGGVVELFTGGAGHTTIVGYFQNANGIYAGDDVVILGVPVGKIDKIEPQPDRVKISFWYDNKYKVPADAKAVVLNPNLVTVRALQLVPVYTGGPALADGAVLPMTRTAVPVEFDDLRDQLENLAKTLQPSQPGGLSTLGSLVETAATDLRGQGAVNRDAVIKLSQAVSGLSDHSGDLYGTFKNLATLVHALRDSSGVLRELNENLGTVTDLLDNGKPNNRNEFADIVSGANGLTPRLTTFLHDNTDRLGITVDQAKSISDEILAQIYQVKQALHAGPHALQNVTNLYQPAQTAFTGALALTNFQNTIQFLCSSIQAASRLGAEESARRCAQYLAPIIRNRQVNFLPLGFNLFSGPAARPNEVTYSEDYLRPDYIPPLGTPQPTEAYRTVPPPPFGPLPPANEMYTFFGTSADPYHGPNTGRGPGEKCCGPYVPAKPAPALTFDPVTGLPTIATDPATGLPTVDVVPTGGVGGS